MKLHLLNYLDLVHRKETNLLVTESRCTSNNEESCFKSEYTESEAAAR